MDHITKERRGDPRYPLCLPVILVRDGRVAWGMTENVSAGGLFVHSLRPPDPGEEVEIRLDGPGGVADLVLRGKVAYRRERDKAALPGRGPAGPAGVGVAFKENGAESRERLQRWLGGGLPASTREIPSVEEEGGGDPTRVEDPGRIQAVFERLCLEIRPLAARRLGGWITYPVFLRNIFSGGSGAPEVEVDPVALRDVDAAHAGEIPFVFRFELDEEVYAFSIVQDPRRMEGRWRFPLPSRVFRGRYRSAPRYSLEIKDLLTVEFPDPEGSGARRVKNVMDIGFRGLSFKNYPGEETYVPGQRLTDLRVCDFDHVCKRTDGVVRHVTIVCLPEGGVCQKVGLEFVGEGHSVFEEASGLEQGEEERLGSEGLILQHLRGVASAGTRVLGEREGTIFLADAVLRVRGGNGATGLEAVPRRHRGGKRDFIAVDLTYHYYFRGAYYRFSARTVKEEGRFLVDLPTEIRKVRRRKVLRAEAKGLVKIRFRCLHPVLGGRVSFPVRDLSIRGLSFETDYVRDLFWKGAWLLNGEIFLDDAYHPVGAVKVRSLVQRMNEEGQWRGRCGVEFLDLPVETERRISGYVFSEKNPQIQAPTSERIDQVWRLFRDSGFIYPGKEAYIKKLGPQIRETWIRLLSEETPFYKHVVFREEGKDLGTASAVQVYEKAWLLQHLAATGHPVKLIPKHVMLGLSQFLMENREIKYLITYFREQSSFPRKMYSGFLAQYPLEEQLRFGRYSFLSLDLEGLPGGGMSSSRASESLLIEPAGDRDREIIQNYFRRHLHPLLFRSRSLSRDELHLPETSAAFRSRGLKRERYCLAAKEAGRLVAFALIEDSSPGLNLSGLLSSFSIHSLRPGEPVEPLARRRLIDAVVEWYRGRGSRVAICLTEEEDLGAYFEAGFRKEKEYICLTWSRRTIKSYYDYVQERFSRFEERKQRNAHPRPPS